MAGSRQLSVWNGLQTRDTNCGDGSRQVWMYPTEYLTYGVGDAHAISFKPDGGKNYKITDHLGSTRIVIDENGVLQSQLEYAPFGEQVANYGVNGSSAPRKGFIDKETDGESGLGDYSARKYDDELGRFTSVDALWEKYRSLSPYHYSANDPLRLKDPSGLATYIYYMTPAPLNGLAQSLGHNAIGVETTGSVKSSDISYYEAGGAAEPPGGPPNELQTIKVYVDADRTVYRMQINLSEKAEAYLHKRISGLQNGERPPSGCCTREVKNLLIEAFEYGDGMKRDEAIEKADEIFPNDTFPMGTITDPEELGERGYVGLLVYSKDEEGDYTIQSYSVKTSTGSEDE